MILHKLQRTPRRRVNRQSRLVLRVGRLRWAEEGVEAAEEMTVGRFAGWGCVVVVV